MTVQETSLHIRFLTCALNFLNITADCGYFLLPGVSGAHLDVELRVLVEVVEEFLVIIELSVPLARLRVSKVVTERNEKNGRTEETRLLAVLIQQEESSERTDGNFFIYDSTTRKYTQIKSQKIQKKIFLKTTELNLKKKSAVLMINNTLLFFHDIN